MPDIDDTARARLESRLIRWLEGEDASALGLPTDRQGRVRVVARFPRPIWGADLKRLGKLGLDVEGGAEVATGAFDRDALLVLAHDRAVHGVGPVGTASIPPNPSKPGFRED